MKDKLRELADRWREEASNTFGFHAARKCASELLAILDAEGDGGAVCKVVRAPNGGGYLEWAAGADSLDYVGASLYTHPARSGVASDEDVRDAERYREFCKQASEAAFPISLLEDAFEMGSGVLNLHFDGAKGERHER